MSKPVNSPESGVSATTGDVSRTAQRQRATRETDITVSIDLDGTGRSQLDTGIGFLDHMLDQLARHGLFDLSVKAVGDRHIDDHHTVEDCGIVMGQAFAEALGDRRGIFRYGACLLPMDETLSRVALDLSGRPFLVWRVDFTAAKIGTMDTELFREWFQAFSVHAGATLHVETFYGVNSHHMAESCFKGLARALRQAVTIDPRQAGLVPSTKGMLQGAGKAP